MMRWLIRSVVAVCVLAVLAYGGLYAALHLADIGKVRDRLQKEVQKATGRELVVAGDIKPSVGFSPAVSLYDVRLANPQWAAAPNALEAAHLRAELAIWPLLQGTIRLNAVLLEGATIRLERSKKGTPSWVVASPASAPAPAPAVAKPAATKNESAMRVAQAAVAKSKSSFFLIRKLIIQNADFRYTDHRAGTKTPLKIASLTVDQLSHQGIEQFVLQADYADHQLSAQGALAEGGLLMVQGSLQGKAVQLALSGNVALADLTYDLNLSVDAPKLNQAAALFGTKAGSTDALSLKATLGGTPEVMTINGMKASVGKVAFQGKGRLNLSGTIPYVQASIEMPSLVIAPPAKSAVTTAAAPPESTTETEAAIPPAADMLPWEAMKAVNGDVALTIRALDYQGVALSNLNATLKLADGRLTLQPFSAELAKGTLKGSLQADATLPNPQMTLDLLIDEVVLGDVLSARAQKETLRGGALQAHLSLAGSGKTSAAWLAGAQGSMKLFMNKASYRVTAGQESVDDFLSLLRGSDDESKALRLECAVGRFDVKGGLATSSLLALKTSGAVADGSGTFRLHDAHINIVLKARSGLVGLADVVPPLRFKGPIDDPSIRPDAGGTLLGLGKWAIGAATGVGLVAVLGEKVADGLGITADNNPCLTAIARAQAEAQQQPPANGQQLKQQYDKTEDAVRAKRDAIKEDYQTIRDGVKGLLGD